MTQARSFDPIWEEIYGEGKQLNKYPFSSVVTFFYRHRPSPSPAFLEVGFGAGNNLWFAAREGAQVSGVEASTAAVAHARKRFAAEGLTGDLRVGDFTALPFAEGMFDMALDRGALCCAGQAAVEKAIAEVQRTLKPGGVFMSEGFSERTSFAREPGPDGTFINRSGPLLGVGQMRFDSAARIDALFAQGWDVEALNFIDTSYTRHQPPQLLGCWQVIARKK